VYGLVGHNSIFWVHASRIVHAHHAGLCGEQTFMSAHLQQLMLCVRLNTIQRRLAGVRLFALQPSATWMWEIAASSTPGTAQQRGHV
jgi:hypothetical protein